MKKILYIHQYFKTPEEGGAIRSYYLAKGLADHGYKVTVITSHGEDKVVTKQIEGYTVHYLPVKYDNSMGFYRRVIAFLRFVLLTIRYCSKLPKQDICYATSTPLTIGLIALRLKKKLKLPYYFEVRDLWPEAPIQMGAIKNPVAIRVLRYLEKRIYLGADKIVALSPGIRDSIAKTVPGKKIFLIPNMSDTDFFKPGKKLDFAGDPENAEDFVVTYFGAIGEVNHLEYFIDVIQEAKKNQLKMKFRIVGKGSSLEKIRNLSENLGLGDILTFLPFRSKEDLMDVLDDTHATYISFANKPILATNSPNKFFDAISAGKLIIINHKGWLNDMIQTHKCGFYANALKPEKFVEKIKPYLENRSKLRKAQKNSRALAELYYSKDLQIEKVLKVFDNEYVMRLNEDQVYTLTA